MHLLNRYFPLSTSVILCYIHRHILVYKQELGGQYSSHTHFCSQTPNYLTKNSLHYTQGLYAIILVYAFIHNALNNIDLVSAFKLDEILEIKTCHRSQNHLHLRHQHLH